MRRSIIARAKSFYQHQPRLSPSLSHITSSDREEFPTKTTSTNSEICSRFLRNRNNSGNSSLLSGNVSRLIGSKIPASYGLILHRNFSNVPSEIEDLEFNGVVGAVGDKAVEAAPAANEVTIAAADSSSLVAAFQDMIDHVHCYTGFEWWASIAATTLLIRFIGLPFRIHRLKFFSKNYTLLRTYELAKENYLKGKGDSDIYKVMYKLIEEYGEIWLSGFVMANVYAWILFFAIWSMAKEVPSFITGGTLWFVDLTTPDRICLPILSALTFWLSLEMDPIYRVQGAVSKSHLRIAVRVLLEAALTSALPSAICCSWITSNLFYIAYGIVMMNPQAQKMLGVSLLPLSTGKKKA